MVIQKSFIPRREYHAIYHPRLIGKEKDVFMRNKKYARTGREKCCICHWVSFWYNFDRDMPHYCWTCSMRLRDMYRGKRWDDTADIPF